MLTANDQGQVISERRHSRDRSRFFRPGPLLLGLGLLSCLPYLYALGLGNLRDETQGFLAAFLGAFSLYWIAVGLVLRIPPDGGKLGKHGWVLLFAVPIVLSVILLFSSPALSDDMYRYVWDGRVQDAGISPYAHPPEAEALRGLRDPVIWRQINRKWAVTVYPPGAEMSWALLWQLFPDSVLAFKGAAVVGGLLAGWLLMPLLRSVGRPEWHALVYLWNPLLIFELAHSGHLDGLVLPLLLAAFLARWRNRDWLVGVCLGGATLLKLYPAVLLPALWRPRQRSRWALPVSFVFTVGAGYLPYLLLGEGVTGFLPRYFSEQFNSGLATLIHRLAGYFTDETDLVVNAVLFGGLALMGLIFVLRPAVSPSQAIRRCLWPMGYFALMTHNLMPWYLLWMLPLLALDLRPGRLLGLRADAPTGWLLFTGLVAFSYTFFIDWRPVPWVVWAEYGPLYVLLLVGGLRWLLGERRVGRLEGA